MFIFLKRGHLLAGISTLGFMVESLACENSGLKTIEDYEMSRPQLIMVTMGANSVDKLTSFYEEVFDFTFTPSLTEGPKANHGRVSSGLFLGINQKYTAGENQSDITLHFHVPDLLKYEKAILEKGGQKVYPFDTPHIPLTIAPSSLGTMKSTYTELTNLSPENITNSLGNFALYEDCEKNKVSLIQLEKWAYPYYYHGKIKDIEYKEMMLSLKKTKSTSGEKEDNK